VVFDEAHNIDDACIEAMSFKINKVILEQGTKNLGRLTKKVEEINQQGFIFINNIILAKIFKKFKI
jgi:Rad3-related DNA helicase